MKGDTFTATNYLAGRAPAHLTLLGDRTRPESAQHIIEFPGGAIELTRTSTGDYWAHILVNQGPFGADWEGFKGAGGEVVGSRIQTADGLVEIPGYQTVAQIAVLIRPVRAYREVGG